MKISTPEQEKLGGYALLLIVIVVFFGLLVKNSGIFPFIFGDEYTYSLHSRLLPISESAIPGYIYLSIYRLTNHCATDFLGCARIFNAFFFVCAAPFIYQISRRVMAVLPALLITLCALLAPVNAYTAHYMPEAFYFFGFWAFVWALTRVRIEASQSWAIAGFILGCTTLIKPHSMLFIPALIVYISYVSLTGTQGRISLAARNLGSFFLAAIVAKFAISFVLAGTAGLTLFGPSYNKIASEAGGLARVIQLATLALESIQGHVLAICLTIGLGLATTLQLGLKPLLAWRAPTEAQKVAILSALIIANLVVVTSVFSATVVGVGSHESITRLHIRYYDFAFPLLWIVVASLLNRPDSPEPRRWRIVLATLIGAALLFGLTTGMEGYEPSIIDSPELRGFVSDQASFYLMAVLGLLALCTWAYSPRTGAQAFVYLVLPVTVILSSYWVTKEQREHLTPSTADRAGTFTRQYLSAEERAGIIIVGADLGALMNTAFYIDTPRLWPFLITSNVAYDFQGLAPDISWMLSIGNYVPPAEGRVQVQMPGFTLTKIHLPQD